MNELRFLAHFRLILGCLLFLEYIGKFTNDRKHPPQVPTLDTFKALGIPEELALELCERSFFDMATSVVASGGDVCRISSFVHIRGRCTDTVSRLFITAIQSTEMIFPQTDSPCVYRVKHLLRPTADLLARSSDTLPLTLMTDCAIVQLYERSPHLHAKYSLPVYEGTDELEVCSVSVSSSSQQSQTALSHCKPLTIGLNRTAQSTARLR